MFTSLLADKWLTTDQLSQSELLYNLQFTANQFALVPTLLGFMARVLFVGNPYGHSPYIISSLARRWVCLLWIGLASAKCLFRTYSIILKFFSFTTGTRLLSVQALQDRSCLSYLAYATTAAYSLERLYTWQLSSLSLLYILCLA
jgi:hypothetical protein